MELKEGPCLELYHWVLDNYPRSVQSVLELAYKEPDGKYIKKIFKAWFKRVPYNGDEHLSTYAVAYMLCEHYEMPVPKYITQFCTVNYGLYFDSSQYLYVHSVSKSPEVSMRQAPRTFSQEYQQAVSDYIKKYNPEYNPEYVKVNNKDHWTGLAADFKIKQENEMIFQTKHYVNGAPCDDMSVAELINCIAKAEEEIQNLKKIKTESKAVKKEITRLNAFIRSVTKVADSK